MQNNQTWGMVLIVAGMLGLIAVPLSGNFIAAMVAICIFGLGYIVQKNYIQKDEDNGKEKE